MILDIVEPKILTLKCFDGLKTFLEVINWIVFTWRLSATIRWKEIVSWKVIHLDPIGFHYIIFPLIFPIHLYDLDAFNHMATFFSFAHLFWHFREFYLFIWSIKKMVIIFIYNLDYDSSESFASEYISRKSRRKVIRHH